ncbi:MAG: DUF4157 domain-containing protein [Ramlibacter sp.]|nr:DUF4157 domain-containing protein [Ramlibacter sp.]
MPKIIYTRLLFWSDAFTVCAGLVLIHPAHRDDEALLQHELAHVAQMLTDGLLTWWWRYLTSARHRLLYEVLAYRRQLELAPGSLQTFAGYLVNNYGLRISLEQALAWLSDPTTLDRPAQPAQP